MPKFATFAVLSKHAKEYFHAATSCKRGKKSYIAAIKNGKMQIKREGNFVPQLTKSMETDHVSRPISNLLISMLKPMVRLDTHFLMIFIAMM